MTARQGARAALGLGLLASLAGNVVAASPTALGRVVAAWPPLALMVAVELVARIPSRGGPASAARMGAAALLAAIAGWASYWHLVELAHRAGEGGVTAHLLPLSVDGLIAVASVCLRELSAPAQVAGEGVLSAEPPAPAPVSAHAPEPIAPPTRKGRPPGSKGRPSPAPGYDDLAAFATAYAEAVERLGPKPTGKAIAAALGMGERTYYRRLADAKAAGLIDAGDPDAELAQMTQPTLMEVAP